MSDITVSQAGPTKIVRRYPITNLVGQGFESMGNYSTRHRTELASFGNVHASKLFIVQCVMKLIVILEKQNVDLKLYMVLKMYMSQNKLLMFVECQFPE